MKKFFWVLLLFLVFAVIIFFKWQINQRGATDKLVYNPDLQQWEKYNKEDSESEERQAILQAINEPDNNMDGLHNPAVFKGYFDSYDQDTQLLTVKAVLPFTQGGLFKKKQAKLLPGQSIHCAPAIYIDPNTNQAWEVKNFELPVKDGETLSFHVEKIISFTDFLQDSTDQTFLHVQLTDDYDENKINYIQKILVIGLCE